MFKMVRHRPALLLGRIRCYYIPTATFLSQSYLLQKTCFPALSRRFARSIPNRYKVSPKSSHLFTRTISQAGSLHKAPLDSTNDLYIRLQDLNSHLYFRGYSVLKAMGVMFGLSGLYMYVFREDIKDTVADVTAEITSKSLSDQDLLIKAQDLFKSVVYEILADPQTLASASQFIEHLAQQKDVQEALGKLVNVVCADPVVAENIRQMLQAVMLQLLEDESVKTYTLNLLYWVLGQPSMKEAAVGLFQDIFADPSFQESAYEFFGGVMASESMYRESNKLGVYTAQSVLEDEGIRNYAATVMRDVLNDDMLQQEGGDAIWQAFKYSLPLSGIFGSKSRRDTEGTTPTADKAAQDTKPTKVVANVTDVLERNEPIGQAGDKILLSMEYPRSDDQEPVIEEQAMSVKTELPVPEFNDTPVLETIPTETKIAGAPETIDTVDLQVPDDKDKCSSGDHKEENEAVGMETGLTNTITLFEFQDEDIAERPTVLPSASKTGDLPSESLVTVKLDDIIRDLSPQEQWDSQALFDE